jgi:hypothetical protein
MEQWNLVPVCQHPLPHTQEPSEPIEDENRISGWSLNGEVFLV